MILSSELVNLIIEIKQKILDAHIKDTGSMYILDRQHRMATLRAAINPTEDDKKVLNKKLEQTNELNLLKSKWY